MQNLCLSSVELLTTFTSMSVGRIFLLSFMSLSSIDLFLQCEGWCLISSWCWIVLMELFVSYWQNANRRGVSWINWIKVQTSHSNWFCTSFHCPCTPLNVQTESVSKLASVCEIKVSQSNFNPTHAQQTYTCC